MMGSTWRPAFPAPGGTRRPLPVCASLAPAPVSDARIVLHVDRLRFTDTLGVGQPNGAGVIEMVAYDQGRSTIEIHVQRSDIIGAAAAGIFTFYFSGRPGKDVIDFGCVNPDPAGTSPDPAACRRAGYTSIGQNRIFGNSRRSKTHTPMGEIALQGPGAMMAQGNYFGDIAPADGKGDALGECHVMPWPTDPRNEPPPARAIPNARCELYDIPGQGKPTGIDARFHLPRIHARPNDWRNYSDTTGSPNNSARAAWARSTAPATSISTAMSRSRSFRPARSATNRHGGGSAVKRRRCPG